MLPRPSRLIGEHAEAVRPPVAKAHNTDLYTLVNARLPLQNPEPWESPKVPYPNTH